MATSKLTQWCTFFLVLCCMLCPSVFATDTYAVSRTFYATDNNSSCFATSTVNCWTPLAGVVNQISVGADGTVYGVASDLKVYRLPKTKGTVKAAWVLSSLPNMPIVVVQDSQNIYGLSQSSFCAAGSYEVFKANAALNAWVGVSPLGCLQNLAVSMDGTLTGVNAGIGYVLKPGAVAWGALGTGWTRIAVQNQHAAVGLKGAAVYKINLDSATATVISSIGSAGTGITVDAFGVLWIIGGTNSSGNGNIYSYNTVTGTIMAYRGIYSQVFSGGQDGTFALTSAGVPAHLNRTIVSMQIRLTGSYNCAASFPITGVCPTGSAHTASVKAAFIAGGRHGAGGVTAFSSAQAPALPFNLAVAEDAVGCDMFFGDPASTSCQISGSAGGAITCSAMGNLYNNTLGSTGFMSNFVEFAWTRVKFIGAVTNCTQGTLGLTCDFGTVSWCTPATTPPDMPIISVRDLDVPEVESPTYWDTYGVCVRLGAGYAWECGPSPTHPALRQSFVDNWPPQACKKTGVN